MEVRLTTELMYRNVVRMEEDDENLLLALRPDFGQVAGSVVRIPLSSIVRTEVDMEELK